MICHECGLEFKKGFHLSDFDEQIRYFIDEPNDEEESSFVYCPYCAAWLLKWAKIVDRAMDGPHIMIDKLREVYDIAKFPDNRTFNFVIRNAAKFTTMMENREDEILNRMWNLRTKKREKTKK